MTITRDIKLLGIESAHTEKPLDEAKTELETNGYEIISLKQFADLRINQGRWSQIATYGAYTREGCLYVPQKGAFLVRNSPTITNAKEATEGHRNNQEFYLTSEQTEKALSDSVQIKIQSGEKIPTKRFGDDEITTYAFGDSARDYGEFLNKVGIEYIHIWLANIEQKTFARGVWLHTLGIAGTSAIDGSDRSLHKNVAVRGIKFINLENKVA